MLDIKKGDSTQGLSCYSLYFHILEFRIKMNRRKRKSDDDVKWPKKKTKHKNKDIE